MVKQYLVSVLYRVLLCWACVAALAFFVVTVDIAALTLASDGASSFDRSIVVFFVYFVKMVVSAINISLIWAVVDAVYCEFFERYRTGPRYLIAILLGLIGAATIYLGLTEQYPTLFLTSWIDAPVMGYLWAWYSEPLVEAEQFSAGGGLTYILYGIANVVCVSGALAPVLATYIDEQRIKSSA